MADKEFDFTIVNELGVLSASPKEWTKELNLILWNGREAKYDIRGWAQEHAKMGKGVTLSEEEIGAFKKLLSEIYERGVDV